jgi:HlyD family secretion protein
MKKLLLVLLVVVGLVAGGAAFYTKYLGGPAPNAFRTTPVKRGDLQITIGATGTLEPEEVVDVGAQVVGPILNFGDDPRGDTDPQFKDKHVDYGTPVEEDTVLAQIDPAVYKASRDQAQASLARSQADLGELIAHRDQSLAEWNRAQKLRNITLQNGSLSPTGDKLGSEPIKAISDSDYDLAKANYEVAVANVNVGQSTIVQAQAALALADTNLGYCTIKSPVKGTIVDRRVNIGQTVVSSLSAPSLFLIAKDLRQIQVWASVNEADIGRLKVGMPVSFTVDAFPNDVFHGSILQIRLNATMTQNVVTYTVVVTTDNSDLKLLPYLTADVKFEVDTRKDVLLVPNAALRWEPKPGQIDPKASETADAPTGKGHKKEEEATEEKPSDEKTNSNPSDQKATSTAGQEASGAQPKQPKEHHEHKVVWVKSGEYVRPIRVRVGASDNTLTEVSGADLTDGMDVVVGEIKDHVASDATTNPFAPQFGRGNRPQPGKGPGQAGQGGAGQGGGGQGGQGRGQGQGQGQKGP